MELVSGHRGGTRGGSSTPGLVAPHALAERGDRHDRVEKRDYVALTEAGQYMRIRVLLVDDHEIVRRGLSMVLQGESDIEIVGEAGSGSSAIELARQLQPDVILMDVSMPGVSGAEATQIIHGEFPGIRVVGLSVFDDTRVIAKMVAAGAAAYVTKGGDPSTLLAAVRGASTSADVA